MSDPIGQVPRGRWETLDHLRGLSVIAMLLSLTPGAWEHQYGWLVHAKWEGWTLIDMVAPGFLVCVGAVMPLSLGRRIAGGVGTTSIHVHLLARALGMVLLGLFLNAYPAFDFTHLRLPGVLQRIGVSYALVGLLVLACRRGNTLDISAPRMAAAAGLILVSYGTLLYYVPVPGYGAPRFDPIGSWPAVIDRALFTEPHMFKWWPIDGKVVFDPDGALSAYPSCALILLGVTVGVTWPRVARPALTAVAAGAVLMALAVCLESFCPIVKNIWTPTFVLLSGGFALVLLAALALFEGQGPARSVLLPARVFGANALLAYLICFLFAPVLDASWIPSAGYGSVSLRWGSQILLAGMAPGASSLLFGVAYLMLLLPPLGWAYRRRWFLRL